MSTSRKRTLFTNAGLATAVTLSLCLLSGCNGARFLMGGDPSQPVQTTGGQPSTSGVTPSQPAITTFDLDASLNGAPVEIASVRAYDAFTGAPLEVKADNVIAAGGGNVIAAGGGNVVAAGGGNYVVHAVRSNLRIIFPNPNFNPVRIVVTTTTGKTLTSYGNGNYGSAGTANQVDIVKINASTTIASQFGRGPLKMMGSLKPEVAKALVTSFLSALDSLTARIDQELDPATADKLVSNADTNGTITNQTDLSQFLKSSGLDTQVNDTVKAATTSVAEKAADRSNVIKDVQVTASDFAGTSYDIKIDGGKVIITNKDTGDVSIVDLTPGTSQGGVDGSGDQTTTDPTQQDGVTLDPNNTTQGDPNVAPVYSDQSGFSPTITLTRSAGSPHLTVKVQEYANQDNILTIYSRVLKTDATLSLPAGAGAEIQTGTSETVLADNITHLALRIKQGTVTKTDWSMLYNGGVTTLSNPIWQGHIESMGGKQIADFLVYDQGSYYYLVTNYLSSSAITVKGPTTTLCTDVVTINSGAKAQSSLVSRGGKTVETSNTL